MEKIIPVLLLFIVFLPQTAQARPVSYPGGWTFIMENDGHSNAALLHYTPNVHYSLGLRHEYLRGSKTNADMIQLNWLVRRWNMEGSQANIYLKSGIGMAYDDNDKALAGFTGIAADWENRLFFAGYSNKFFRAGNLDSFGHHQARIGIAPYIGDYGNLHTWIMLQGDYRPKLDSSEELSVTPLLRFFKGTSLLETGYNIENETLLINFIQRF